jgi:hypothetical protein
MFDAGEGFASTGDVDFDRCRFASFVFGLLRKSKIRLLYAHDPNQVAGEIEELSYDAHGRLMIEARVDHLEARRCNGFSVGGRVRAYELRDVDNKGFHAVITDCGLSEISLVERLANRFAVVQSRFSANVQARLYDHMFGLRRRAPEVRNLAAGAVCGDDAAQYGLREI